ncbi:MAG TPA: hypothetical protein VGN13_12460 [Solirubrobacteraceae bacterium]|jgi:hypothetical protein
MPAVQSAAQALTAKGGLDSGQLQEICAEAASAASGALYELSGQVYTGACGPVTVRPVSRPTDMDTRSWGAWLSGLGLSGELGTWGIALTTGVLPHYGSSTPPEIDLGVYPVIAVTQVKIDGVVIPSTEYELRSHKRLIRLRTSASATPTDRWGWPTAQVADLPDTEAGTFSVTYTYGQAPPALGVIAARKLAEYIARPQLGDNKGYPQRVTSMQRQGVSAMVVDVIDVLNKGATGIYEVDLFIRSVNPNKNARQAAVWSPDLGRARRTAA